MPQLTLVRRMSLGSSGAAVEGYAFPFDNMSVFQSFMEQAIFPRTDGQLISTFVEDDWKMLDLCTCIIRLHALWDTLHSRTNTITRLDTTFLPLNDDAFRNELITKICHYTGSSGEAFHILGSIRSNNGYFVGFSHNRPNSSVYRHLFRDDIQAEALRYLEDISNKCRDNAGILQPKTNLLEYERYWVARNTAFAMGAHRRLGSRSLIHTLDPYMMSEISRHFNQ